MFISSNDIAQNTHLGADLLIIGAGAAGITIARHFAGRSKRVILLESGGKAYDNAVQSLYEGTSIGVGVNPPLNASRLRYFGGTTNHWTGWCRPLEATDFEKRIDWPESGWPITRADLEPYYVKAGTLCKLGTASFDDIAYWQRNRGGEKVKLLPLDTERFRSAIFQISNSTIFADLYGPELRAAHNIDVVLDATVLELLPAAGHHPDQARKRIGSVRVGTLKGHSFTVSARAVVVAAGGIESARLLLLSDKVHPNGAGNEEDLVGRYFMDHVWLNSNSYWHFGQPGLNLPVYFDELRIGDARIFAAITGTKRLLEREHIGAFRIWLRPSNISNAGVDSVHSIADAIALWRMPPHFLTHLENIFGDIDVLADAAYKSLLRTNKGLLSSKDGIPNTGAWIDLNFEQRPDPDSRVQLGADLDALGQRRLKLDWRLGQTDRHTAMRVLELLAQEFGRLGMGRSHVSLDLSHDANWPANMLASCHHSGTARMSANPKTGVVDEQCRVHSVENLYIAGSAVFPTIGYANPTLTIVALAKRLAETLDRILT